MFRLHKEGTTTIIITCLLVILVGLLLMWLVPNPYRSLAVVVLLFFLLLILYFFRIPSRTYITSGDDLIVSPCDGKVVVIEDVEEREFLKTKCTQISIFMSPLNVHINWYPCNGDIVYSKHHHGKYLVAWHPKSSLENERTTTVIKCMDTHILVRQIAGAVARRIVNYAKIGQKAALSDQLGFIKFGSRVDVLIPLNSSIEVSIDQIVKGGQTILAKL
ncbi:MAG: phosphatidylserine decarboxylase family protein [Saprospiraceae bacterium]|nr:phosphatidylserine decarboxylase family protein [Saprospiraceae bacterium]